MKKAKKIAKILCSIIVFCCVVAGVSYLMDHYMFQTLELSLALIAGLGLPFAFVKMHWSESKPHVPVFWWIQAVLWFAMCFICAPLTIHGTMDGVPVIWNTIASWASWFGIFCLGFSIVLFASKAIMRFNEMRWNRLWRHASRCV